MTKLTDSQKALRHDFPRGKRVATLSGSAGTVRGHKDDYVRVMLEGPTCHGLALVRRAEFAG